jgi:formamidopyrimidine-DNA glycosylase
MPELPEVDSIVLDLKREILGKRIVDLWTDFPQNIKKPKSLFLFKKLLLKNKILNIKRRGKNILFFLSNNYILLFHLKMTGHLLLGNWKKKKGKWISEIGGTFAERVNSYLHFILWLDDGRQLGLSDLRKFAKIALFKKEKLKEELGKLGEEPLSKAFTFEKFKEIIKRKKRGIIKKILMDQTLIAGIGNIYSDEILWRAKIHPKKEINNLSIKDLKKIYHIMIKVLKTAIKLKGESFSDFRNIYGEKGLFDIERKVYKREKEKCFRCNFPIERIKIGSRSSYFCPQCQKL